MRSSSLWASFSFSVWTRMVLLLVPSLVMLALSPGATWATASRARDS